ncbi:MAG: asparagine synthase (glutamine-hydrolyzing) [Proteobacteria bacterium]|nr:asparagine synthase (glutamine-hydrolyzing) [Pseudomonadota bacterium]
MNFQGQPVDEGLVARMCDSLAHRGPDGRGVMARGEMGLGHRRLAILDLSDKGAQPMSSADQSLWLTYNGEIYNFLDIRNELEALGHSFRSGTDTEVILAAYREWGRACINRFNGMFAFGLWDEPLKRLWLVRDRMGIKPLFYCLDKTGVRFGSEIKAVLEDGMQRKVSPLALSLFLGLNWMPAPHTMLADIKQLLPGQQLTVHADGRHELDRYWDLGCMQSAPRSDARWAEDFDSLMHEAVNMRLVSDVPFGAFLSGGLDSSSICWWMSRSISDLNTFSIGFKERSYDETSYAEQVVEHLGVRSFRREVDAFEVPSLLEAVVSHAEEPTADSSMLAVYLLSELARKHVTMVHSGDGADELLAGYETYQASLLARTYGRLPSMVRRGVAGLVNSIPASEAKVSLDFKLKRFVAGAGLSPERAHASWRMIHDQEGKSALCPELFRGGDDAVFSLYEEYFRACPASRPLDRLLWVDTRLYLPNDMLVKVDRMTMAHGLEARVPFLDHRVAEFCFSMPAEMKLRAGLRKKYLLKKVMAERLPRKILGRKKAGFNLPVGLWLRTSFHDYAREILGQGVREMGVLDARQVERLLSEHRRKVRDHSHQLWNLLVLVLWWKRFGRPTL